MLADPALFVTLDEAPIVAVPATLQVTVTLLTGWSRASVTRTTSGCAGVPPTPLCGLPDVAVTADAGRGSAVAENATPLPVASVAVMPYVPATAGSV
jgi:hypothetical protein